MTHSSQWHSSQKMRMRLPSPSCLKISAAVWKSSVLGIWSSSRSMDWPWSWGSFLSSIGRRLLLEKYSTTPGAVGEESKFRRALPGDGEMW